MMADLMNAINILYRLLIILLLPLISGCAVAAISAAGASMGVSYTMNNIAYKTFNFRAALVEEATVEALEKMEFLVAEHENYGIDKDFRAYAKDLDIRITLESLSAKTTRMTVDARKRPFFKDKATALEIIYQASKILEPEVGAGINTE
jgi:hypothetical protein